MHFLVFVIEWVPWSGMIPVAAYSLSSLADSVLFSVWTVMFWPSFVTFYWGFVVVIVSIQSLPVVCILWLLHHVIVCMIIWFLLVFLTKLMLMLLNLIWLKVVIIMRLLLNVIILFASKLDLVMPFLLLIGTFVKTLAISLNTAALMVTGIVLNYKCMIFSLQFSMASPTYWGLTFNVTVSVTFMFALLWIPLGDFTSLHSVLFVIWLDVMEHLLAGFWSLKIVGMARGGGFILSLGC